jgi:O-antigen/teichoic acid export membrane protein
MSTLKTDVQTSSIMLMFGAQTYGTLINIIDKLATLPLFMMFWGVDLYGEWLILRAVPAYLAIAELGFATAAANRMSVLLANNQREIAAEYFQSAFAVLVAVTLCIFTSMIVLLKLLDVRMFFNFSNHFSYNLFSVILLLLGYTALIFQTQLLSAAYRSVGCYVKAAYITYLIRTVELCGVVVVLVSGGGLLAAALCYFLVRLAGAWIMALLLFRKENWLRFGIASASLRAIREMLPDAAGFLAFPFGQAMSLQGAVFVIANLMSPAAVALFSASRTLTLTIVQFGMQINRSVWPELTRLCAGHNNDLAKKVYIAASGSFCWLGVFSSTALLLFAPWIFEIWTAGRMVPDLWMFALLLLAAVASGFWYSALSVLVATDSHKRVAVIYLLISVLSLPLAYWFGLTQGGEGIAMVILTTELVMVFAVLRASLSRLDISVEFLAKGILMLPIMYVRRYSKRHING